ncbi:MAG TPA: hypothetical protein PLI48_00070 [Gammaproteobacteria bacterium]|nr:hypothetical protein [Gammaproteobacteria bacterium]HRP85924.1 hypothetical protein [Gammaproteobacteria bacterium]
MKLGVENLHASAPARSTRAARPLRLAVAALVAGALGACGGNGDETGPTIVDPVILDPVADAQDESNDRIEITNTQSALDIRVIYPETPIPVDADGAGYGSEAPVAMERIDFDQLASVTLTLASEISPPVVDNQVVQATAIAQSIGNNAVVSYNMRGEPRLGAIDWVMRLNSARPALGSSATFNDADVSAVSTDGRNVYMAMASGAPEFPFPAVVERLRVEGNRLTLAGNERAPLTSFVATSVVAVGDTVYATSGNTGGVFALAEDDLGRLGEFPLHDARWVASDPEGGRIAVVQGTPGQVSVFAGGEFAGGGMTLLNTFPFSGADVPESKSTVEVAGNKAFIAAGPEGVQVMCLDDGEIVGHVPRPDPAQLGLDSSVVVSNAVTVDGDLMFISNGEAGVYVARAAQPFASSDCSPQDITVIGKLRFDELQSANHVSFRGDYLFVAAGLGGVKIVRVRRN